MSRINFHSSKAGLIVYISASIISSLHLSQFRTHVKTIMSAMFQCPFEISYFTIASLSLYSIVPYLSRSVGRAAFMSLFVI